MVTREDVAKKAGVSVSAVSRTMNRRGYVAKDKKEAIYKAVNELGYRANPLSSSLKNGQTYQLCFLDVDISNSFYIEVFKYLAFYAEKRGYQLFLLSSFNMEKMNTMLMDGMIIEDEATASAMQKLMGENILLPLVSLSYGVPIIRTKNIPYVDVDTYDAMEMAIAYLKEMGHKKIAYATPYSKVINKTVQSRYVAYENIMKEELGKRYLDYIIISEGKEQMRKSFDNENYFEEGMRGAEEFHRRKLDATAIICFNDEFALGFISRLKQMKYKIPKDISVMGIDGIQNRKYTIPLLTTISLNAEAQAKVCIDVIIDLIEDKTVSQFTSVKPCLLKGESVKRLR